MKQTLSRLITMVGSIGLMAFFSISVSADVIHLKNGRKIEGIISHESSTKIVLNLGIGSVTLSRKKIKSIERSSDTTEADTIDAWKKKYFSHAKYAPYEHQGLAAEYRLLVDMRQDVLSAKSSHGRIKDQIVAKKKAILNQRNRVVDANRTLQRLDAARQIKTIEEHNKYIARINTENARLVVLHDQLDKLESRAKSGGSSLIPYINALEKFRTHFAAAATLSNRSSYPDFFNPIEEKLTRFQKDLKNTTLLPKPDGDPRRFLVTAIINNTYAGTFVVDTGATTMTLSRAFAQKLNLDLTGPTSRGSLADGSFITTIPVILDSVSVGEAHARYVEAMVLAQPPDDSVDGLLGMTFLQHFLVKLDPGTGALTLTGFSSGQK